MNRNMKKENILKGLAVGAFAVCAMTACTDEIAFGDSFIEKAPGGSVSIDTVFSSPIYTEQFLTSLYARQYYGLPFSSASGIANSQSPYTGKFDGLTDCYQLHWGNAAVSSRYYTGSLTANDTPLMSFAYDQVWEVIRLGWMLVENINRVPDLSDQQKAHFVAQAKCIMASRYFDLFPHYGGLPLIDHTYTGTESTFALERATVDETVEFMVKLLDEAIPNLQWAWNGNTPETNDTNMGRWTKAGALALKAKILTFAASPMWNNAEPYYDGTTDAEQKKLVWYGDFQQSRWERAKDACKDFFDAVAANGYYELVQATAKTNDAYRQAYRMGYILDNSPEVLHYTRVASTYGTQGTYCWWSWGVTTGGIHRNNYTPTQEYVDMFPWSDGTPFNWEKDSLAGRIDGANGRLFYKFTAIRGGFKKEASRDPRLYENAYVNSQPITLDWTTGVASGNIMEFWVGGYNAAFNVVNDKGEITEALTTVCPTGYGNIKYLLGEEYHRKYDMHWNVVTLPEMYLMYAECLAQCGDNAGAIKQADVVRKRVGLGSLTMGHAEIASDKNALIEEILRERACELGMTNNRFFDMIRYKRTDWMCKELHGLAIYRMQQGSTGTWGRVMKPWLGDDKDSGTKEPSRFEYERFTLSQPSRRVLWDKDPNSTEVKKWLMSPFPQNEINKQYGLVQNPGW